MKKQIFAAAAVLGLVMPAAAFAQGTGLINSANINDQNEVSIYSGAGASGIESESTYAGSNSDRTTEFGARPNGDTINFGDQTMGFENEAEGVANTTAAWSGDGDTSVRGHFNGTGTMDQTLSLNGNTSEVDARLRAYGTIEADTEINGQSGGSRSYQLSSGEFSAQAGNQTYSQTPGAQVTFRLGQYAETAGGANGSGFASSTSTVQDYGTFNGSANAN